MCLMRLVKVTNACFLLAVAPENIKTSKQSRADEVNGGIHMISRLIIAVAIALFFNPAALIVAQEHPEHPKKTTEHPKKGAEHAKKGGEENR